MLFFIKYLPNDALYPTKTLLIDIRSIGLLTLSLINEFDVVLGNWSVWLASQFVRKFCWQRGTCLVVLNIFIRDQAEIPENKKNLSHESFSDGLRVVFKKRFFFVKRPFGCYIFKILFIPLHVHRNCDVCFTRLIENYSLHFSPAYIK